MPEEKPLAKSVEDRIVSLIEDVSGVYPEGCNPEIEYLKRANAILFVLYCVKGKENGGFIDMFNVEGVVAKLVKSVNPDIYSEFMFLRERGIL